MAFIALVTLTPPTILAASFLLPVGVNFTADPTPPPRAEAAVHAGEHSELRLLVGVWHLHRRTVRSKLRRDKGFRRVVSRQRTLRVLTWDLHGIGSDRRFFGHGGLLS